MDWSLVERVREVEELYTHISGVGSGEGRVVLIEGAAGVGKTCLLGEARKRAEHEGLRVLTARGSELERLFSFGVVRQLLEGHLADPAVRERALSGAAAPAQAAFGPPGDGAAEDPAADVSFTTLHGLFWLVLNIAEEQPLILAVDDLQWADRASLRFLGYLAGRLEGQPVLVLATLRTGDPGADVALLGEIAHAPGTDAIRPGPFSPDAVSELVRERLGPNAEPAFCEACHVATGGNPLLLGQVLSALRADDVRPIAENAGLVRDIGPQAVSRTVLLRLARLPEAATAVARAVAVLGDGADLATISAFARLDEAAVAEAAGALARAEILTPRVPLRFVHPLVRDTVYEQLSATERELEHAHAAQVMIAAGAREEQVAAHLLEMARRSEQWVVDRLLEVARAAVAQGSPDGAVSYLRRALEEPAPESQRPQLLLELGMAEALTSGPDAVEHLREAFASIDDVGVYAAAAPVLAQSLVFTGRPVEATVFAREVAAGLPDDLVDLREILEAIELGTTIFGVAEPDMLRRLVQYRERTFGPGPGAKMLAALTAWEWALTGGEATRCAELAREALADDTLVHADNGFLTVPAISVLFTADLDEAPARWARLLADSHACGSLFAISCVHLWNGMTMIRRGELAEAEELLRAGRNELKLWGVEPVDGAYFTSTLALVRLERGDVEGARRELSSGPDPHYDAYDAAHLWRRSEVEVLLAEGRDEEALARAEEYGHVVGRVVNPAWVPWRSLRAIALDRLGRTEEAIAQAEEELVHARNWGAPGTVGRTLRVLGTLRRDEGLAELEASVAVLEGSPARLELARSLAALGALLRRLRRPSDARE
ncbi:MAG: transcriptional regulator, LuxR family, partial [Solirubrobacterales bacterium]|nr:transcriptional regulator, LuxR family [Solirubrobacterales bacterium]